MAPGLVRGGIDLHVLALDPGRTHQKKRLEQAGATVHAAPRQLGRFANVKLVRDIARRVSPAVIHTTLFEADVSGRTAAWLLGVPTSSSIVNDSYSPSHYAESSELKLHAARALDASTAVFARRFHSITEAIASNVAPRLGIPRHKIDVIPRGRDPRDFPFRPATARARVRAELGLSKQTPVILGVGRHEPQKGFQHLLGALPTISRDHPGLVTLIAGRDGRSTQALRSQALGTSQDVRFLGHRTDIADLLAASDVFCFPSEREGFGGVLIEAMAVGCPIVASAIPTSIEVLGNSDPAAGVLAPVGDVAALASALSEVLGNPFTAQRRAEVARERFQDTFTIDAVSGQMTEFFQRVRGTRAD